MKTLFAFIIALVSSVIAFWIALLICRGMGIERETALFGAAFFSGNILQLSLRVYDKIRDNNLV